VSAVTGFFVIVSAIIVGEVGRYAVAWAYKRVCWDRLNYFQRMGAPTPGLR
jgi:hypothetical protein